MLSKCEQTGASDSSKGDDRPCFAQEIGSARQLSIGVWGCCQTLEEDMRNTFRLAMAFVLTVLLNVVANKWLSVWPLMADTNFMLSFHNVFWKHFGMHLGTRYHMT